MLHPAPCRLFNMTNQDQSATVRHNLPTGASENKTQKGAQDRPCQTPIFDSIGLSVRKYLHALCRLHHLVFNGMFKGIAKKAKSLALLGWAVTGCSPLPEGIHPVGNFKTKEYLGTWYEIARLDHRFERNVERVSAHYTLRPDGTLGVLNRGFRTTDSVWKSAQGKARFVGSTDTAHLEVSFFGPFYSSYVVFGLDSAAYQYAFVCGPDRKYLWLLSRTPQVSDSLRNKFVQESQALGFDTTGLIWTKQDSVQGP